MDCYVYILLDSLKPGNYQFGDYHFDFEPFYVGKGTGDRINGHFKNGSLKYHTRKNTRIKKIIENKGKILAIKLHENLSNEKSYSLETIIIKLIGRKDLKNGPLTNHNDGGEGGMTNPSDEIRKKMSERNSIPIVQIDLKTGIKIEIFKSGYEATKNFKVKGRNIKNMRWAYGYGWINLKEINSDNIKILLDNYNRTQENKKIGRIKFWEGKKLPKKMKAKISDSHKKKVAQIDPMTNKIVKIYNSAKEAVEEVGGNIVAVCLGKRKTAAKYKWKYI